MQQDLFGRPPAGEAVTHNVFFALMPDDATRECMARAAGLLREKHSVEGRWLKPARYHMTLHFLGSYSELPLERVAAACEAAGQARFPAFDLPLDRAGHFPKGIGWLGCTQTDIRLRGLWEGLREVLARTGVGVQGHAAFRPHVTVLRDSRDPLPQEPIAPIHWPVREFVLIDSLLGERNEYRTLGRWALQPQG